MRSKSNYTSPAQRQVQAGARKTNFLSAWTMKNKLNSFIIGLALLAGIHQAAAQSA
jgi:hypothetical protein